MKIALVWKLLLSLAIVTLITRAVPREYSSPTNRKKIIPTELPLYSNTLQNLPRLPNGHKQFQFFNLDAEGNLHKQWMSLQEVQNIILAYALSRQSDRGYLKSASSNTYLTGAGFASKPLENTAPKNPKTSVDDVLANVQKVMSKEITNTFLKNEIMKPTLKQPLKGHNTEAMKTTTPSSNDNSTYSTLPSTLLTYLMEEQLASLQTRNPWGITTDLPATIFFDQKYSTPVTETVTETIATPSTTEIPFYFEDLLNENLLQENFLVDRNDEIAIVKGNPNFTSTLTPVDKESEISTDDNSSVKTQDPESDLGITEPTTPSSSDQATKNNFVDSFLTEDSSLSYSTTPPPRKDELTSESTQQDVILFEDATEETFFPLDYSTQAILQLLLTDTTKHYSYTTPHTKYYEDETKSNFVSEFDYISPNQNTPTQSPLTFEDQTTNEVTTSFSIYPQVSQVEKLPNNSHVSHLISKSSNSLASSNIASPGFETNVLTPLEIAQLPHGNVKNLASLQADEIYDEYGVDDSPIYLEDLAEITYDYEDSRKPANPVLHSKPMDFPSPETANSYHRPEHVSGKLPNQDDNVNFLQYLPAYNPTLAQTENPLRKTPPGNQGLHITVANLDPEIRNYVNTMNEVAFQVYKEAIKIHRRQNLVMSPLNLISTLSMFVLGARNATSSSLSRVLQGDRFLKFNPHLVLKDIRTSALKLNKNGHESAFVNNLFTQKSRPDVYPLDLYTRILDRFYKALVEQVDPSEMGSIARDRANAMVREQTNGAVQNFLKPNASFQVLGPMSAVSSAYFQGKWDVNFKDSDLIDMNFIRFPSAERRLIRTVGMSKRLHLNAGYSEEMDATVAEIPLDTLNHEVSLVLVMPGQQKSFVANGLAELEKSLTSDRWIKLLKAVIPHNINFKMPIFSHRNYLNLSGILSKIGLQQLFQDSADFSGINGAKNLYLGDVIQLTEFHSCKLDMRMFSSRTLKPDDKPNLSSVRDLNESVSSNGDIQGVDSLTEHLNESVIPEKVAKTPTEEVTNEEDKEGGRVSESQETGRDWPSGTGKTLAYDRAFFYVLRHNPTGFILFIGRYLDPETF